MTTQQLGKEYPPTRAVREGRSLVKTPIATLCKEKGRYLFVGGIFSGPGLTIRYPNGSAVDLFLIMLLSGLPFIGGGVLLLGIFSHHVGSKFAKPFLAIGSLLVVLGILTWMNHSAVVHYFVPHAPF